MKGKDDILANLRSYEFQSNIRGQKPPQLLKLKITQTPDY